MAKKGYVYDLRINVDTSDVLGALGKVKKNADKIIKDIGEKSIGFDGVFKELLAASEEFAKIEGLLGDVDTRKWESVLKIFRSNPKLGTDIIDGLTGSTQMFATKEQKRGSLVSSARSTNKLYELFGKMAPFDVELLKSMNLDDARNKVADAVRGILVHAVSEMSKGVSVAGFEYRGKTKKHEAVNTLPQSSVKTLINLILDSKYNGKTETKDRYMQSFMQNLRDDSYTAHGFFEGGAAEEYITRFLTSEIDFSDLMQKLFGSFKDIDIDKIAEPIRIAFEEADKIIKSNKSNDEKYRLLRELSGTRYDFGYRWAKESGYDKILEARDKLGKAISLRDKTYEAVDQIATDEKWLEQLESDYGEIEKRGLLASGELQAFAEALDAIRKNLDQARLSLQSQALPVDYVVKQDVPLDKDIRMKQLASLTGKDQEDKWTEDVDELEKILKTRQEVIARLHEERKLSIDEYDELEKITREISQQLQLRKKENEEREKAAKIDELKKEYDSIIKSDDGTDLIDSEKSYEELEKKLKRRKEIEVELHKSGVSVGGAEDDRRIRTKMAKLNMQKYIDEASKTDIPNDLEEYARSIREALKKAAHLITDGERREYEEKIKEIEDKGDSLIFTAGETAGYSSESRKRAIARFSNRRNGVLNDDERAIVEAGEKTVKKMMASEARDGLKYTRDSWSPDGRTNIEAFEKQLKQRKELLDKLAKSGEITAEELEAENAEIEKIYQEYQSRILEKGKGAGFLGRDKKIKIPSLEDFQVSADGVKFKELEIAPPQPEPEPQVDNAFQQNKQAKLADLEAYKVELGSIDDLSEGLRGELAALEISFNEAMDEQQLNEVIAKFDVLKAKIESVRQAFAATKSEASAAYDAYYDSIKDLDYVSVENSDRLSTAGEAIRTAKTPEALDRAKADFEDAQKYIEAQKKAQKAIAAAQTSYDEEWFMRKDDATSLSSAEGMLEELRKEGKLTEEQLDAVAAKIDEVKAKRGAYQSYGVQAEKDFESATTRAEADEAIDVVRDFEIQYGSTLFRQSEIDEKYAEIEKLEQAAKALKESESKVAYDEGFVERLRQAAEMLGKMKTQNVHVNEEIQRMQGLITGAIAEQQRLLAQEEESARAVQQVAEREQKAKAQRESLDKISSGATSLLGEKEITPDKIEKLQNAFKELNGDADLAPDKLKEVEAAIGQVVQRAEDLKNLQSVINSLGRQSTYQGTMDALADIEAQMKKLGLGKDYFDVESAKGSALEKGKSSALATRDAVLEDAKRVFNEDWNLDSEVALVKNAKQRLVDLQNQGLLTERQIQDVVDVLDKIDAKRTAYKKQSKYAAAFDAATTYEEVSKAQAELDVGEYTFGLYDDKRKKKFKQLKAIAGARSLLDSSAGKTEYDAEFLSKLQAAEAELQAMEGVSAQIEQNIREMVTDLGLAVQQMNALKPTESTATKKGKGKQHTSTKEEAEAEVTKFIESVQSRISDPKYWKFSDKPMKGLGAASIRLQEYYDKGLISDELYHAAIGKGLQLDEKHKDWLSYQRAATGFLQNSDRRETSDFGTDSRRVADDLIEMHASTMTELEAKYGAEFADSAKIKPAARETIRNRAIYDRARGFESYDETMVADLQKAIETSKGLSIDTSDLEKQLARIQALNPDVVKFVEDSDGRTVIDGFQDETEHVSKKESVSTSKQSDSLVDENQLVIDGFNKVETEAAELAGESAVAADAVDKFTDELREIPTVTDYSVKKTAEQLEEEKTARQRDTAAKQQKYRDDTELAYMEQIAAKAKGASSHADKVYGDLGLSANVDELSDDTKAVAEAYKKVKDTMAKAQSGDLSSWKEAKKELSEFVSLAMKYKKTLESATAKQAETVPDEVVVPKVEDQVEQDTQAPVVDTKEVADDIVGVATKIDQLGDEAAGAGAAVDKLESEAVDTATAVDKLGSEVADASSNIDTKNVPDGSSGGTGGESSGGDSGNDDFSYWNVKNIRDTGTRLDAGIKSLGIIGAEGELDEDGRKIAELYNAIKKELDAAAVAAELGDKVVLSGVKEKIAALDELMRKYKEVHAASEGTKGKTPTQKSIEDLSKKNKKYGATSWVATQARFNSVESSIKDSNFGFGSSDEFMKKFKVYEEAYKKVRDLKTIIASSTGEVAESTKVEFKQATDACNALGRELESIIRKSKKAESDSYGGIGLADDFKNTDTGRKEAFETFLSANYDQAKVSIEGFSNAYRECTYTVQNGDGTFTKMTATIDEYGRRINVAAGETQKAISPFKKFISDITEKTGQLTTYLISMFGIQEAVQYFKTGIQYVKEIDTALTDLKKVTNETDEAYDSFLQNMSSTASRIGSTVTELTQMAAEWARVGYSMKESATLAESTAILLNVSEFEDATAASEALISTMQAFQYTANESQYVVDVLNEVKFTCLLIQQCILKKMAISGKLWTQTIPRKDFNNTKLIKGGDVIIIFCVLLKNPYRLNGCIW